MTPNRPLILAAVCLGSFTIYVDATIVYVASPPIVRALDASFDQMLWVIDSYLLTLAVLLVTAGRLGDMLGARRAHVAGMTIFAVASALAGAAPSVPVLLFSRILQGVGGALVGPQALSLIAATFPPERLGGAMGIFGAVMGLSCIVGPAAGGFIVSHVSWRWVFLANVPLAVVAIVAMLRFAPDVRPKRAQRLDLVSVLLLTLALGALLFGLIEGERFRWGAVFGGVTIQHIMAAGAALFASFLVWERRSNHALVPGSIFRAPRFLVMTVIGFAVEFALQGLLVGFVVCFQTALGMTPFDAALTFVPLPLAAGLMTVPAGRLIDRQRERAVLGAGLVVFATGIALLGMFVRSRTTPLGFAPAMIVGGLGVGCLIAPVTALALRDVDRERVGTAAGVLNTIRTFAGLIGTAGIGALVQHGLMRQADAIGASRSAVERLCIDATFTAHGRGVALGVTRGTVPPECTEAAAREAQALFSHAYVTSLGPAAGLIVALLLVAAVAAFSMRRDMTATT